MPLRNFNVHVDDVAYQDALRRARSEGKTLENILTEFVRNYAGLEGSQTTTYTVQSGDTLTKIARKFYGDPHKYPLIQAANNLNASGTIWVGQVLVIPPVAGASAGPVSSSPPASPSTPTPPSSTPTPVQQPQPQPQPQPTTPSSPVQSNPTLLNGGFDEFQPRIYEGKPRFWREFPEEYGKYWNMKLIWGKEERRVRFLSSPVFGQLAQALYGASGRVSNYAPHGGNSQVVASQYAYDVVFWQTVAAQPGRNYRFSGSIVSFYKGTDNPATPNKIFKRIGIDPTGGGDYESPNIIWGKRDDTDHEWINPSLEATAQSEAITVFIRLENTEENVGTTELNLIHLDNFKLE